MKALIENHLRSPQNCKDQARLLLIPILNFTDPAEQILDMTEVPNLFADKDIFESPGRAPKPPSYPSPVQPPQSPSFNNRYTNNNARFPPQTTYPPKTRTQPFIQMG